MNLSVLVLAVEQPFMHQFAMLLYLFICIKFSCLPFLHGETSLFPHSLTCTKYKKIFMDYTGSHLMKSCLQD